MSDPSYSEAVQFPSWQMEVQSAQDESEPAKLLARVHAAETAIFRRLQELAGFPSSDRSHDVERDSLANAVETLRVLKRDRLGFPDWQSK